MNMNERGLYAAINGHTQAHLCRYNTQSCVCVIQPGRSVWSFVLKVVAHYFFFFFFNTTPGTVWKSGAVGRLLWRWCKRAQLTLTLFTWQIRGYAWAKGENYTDWCLEMEKAQGSCLVNKCLSCRTLFYSFPVNTNQHVLTIIITE